MPQFEIDIVAIVVAAVAHFFLGFLWYTPLFGRAWAHEMGLDYDAKPTSAQMVKGMSLNLIGNLLMAWVLFSNMAAWNPESWGQGPAETGPLAFAGMAAFFTWLGFFLPVDLNSVAWEQRSWKLLGINTGYKLVSVTLVALILVYL